jgi:transcriptional regulator with XRE-family HTH domain
MFRTRLRELRKSKKLLQKDLADILDIDRNVYRLYEHGIEANFKDLIKICDYFKVTIDYLLGNSDIKNLYQEDSMPEIPEQFTDPDLAREYVSKHKIFEAQGFRTDLMSDEKILDFANYILKNMAMFLDDYCNIHYTTAV